MVRPDDETDHADGDHCIGHAEIAEDRLLRECRDDVADHTEARQNQNIDFRMAEEPEQVLEQEWIAAARTIKENRAEIAVRQQHRYRTGKDGQGQQKHD